MASADPWTELLEGRSDPAGAWKLFDSAWPPQRVHWLQRLTETEPHKAIVEQLGRGADDWDRPSQVALAMARVRVGLAGPGTVEALVRDTSPRSAARILALEPAPRVLGLPLGFELAVVGTLAAKVGWCMLLFVATLAFLEPGVLAEPTMLPWLVIPAALFAISFWDNLKHMDRLRAGPIGLVEKVESQVTYGEVRSRDTRRIQYTYRYVHPTGERYKISIKKFKFGDDGYEGPGPFAVLIAPGSVRLFTDSRHCAAAVSPSGRLTVTWHGWFWIGWVLLTLGVLLASLVRG